MDGAKRRLLEITLRNRFDLQRFIILTKELLKNPKIKSNPIFTDKVRAQYRDSIKLYTEFGRYRDFEDRELLLVAVELNANKSIARSRAMQRNFVKDLLQKESADAALVAFYEPNSPDWRLSFVKIDYKFVGNNLEEEITPARRYSFLIGETEKSHTAMRQLAIILANDASSPTIAQIEDIFNIEKVTNEFFLIYRDKYLELKECLESQEEFISMSKKLNFTGEEFAKKLMGQLSFLYFLQRKGWLGVTANPKSMPAEAAEQLLANKPSNMRDLFKKVYSLAKDIYKRSDAAIKDLSDQQIRMLNSLFVNTPYEGKWGTGEKNFIRTIFYYADKTGQKFYKDYLEPLFYNALNDERGGNTYYRPFNCMIPFLNGGLFQPIVDEYRMNEVAFDIPNTLFSNNNLSKEGDKGDGILDIFDRYAFTVKEDEPLEKEVAVDPEMLGKVFENLLEVKDRKSKGAFYTPREIVHYMCQESLINYLVNETSISHDDINKLIRYGDIIADADNSVMAAKSGKFFLPESIRMNAKKVDDALDDIRIADPAVGSGAFPLGMINEIVRARMNLARYLLPDEYILHRDYAIPDKYKPYNLKLRTIQHSIHAVDIERSAVEITKLRLWLSLVVDEESFSEIRPLPNLEYNIMCGNSLLDEFEGIKLFNEALLEQHPEIAATREASLQQMDIFTPQSQNILDVIYTLQERFFATSDSNEKLELKKRIDDQEWDLIEKSLMENGKVNELYRIRELKRLNSKPYFLWKLNFAKVFRDKGGFDIVIGNPPYIGEKGNKEIFHQVKTTKFGEDFYQRRMDYFYFFIGQGIRLLKNTGVLCYITTNYWITASGGQKLLRPYLKRNTNILRFINFGEYKIFESATGQHNCIFLLERNNADKEKTVLVTEVLDVAQTTKSSLEDILRDGKNIPGIKEYHSQPQSLIYEQKTNNIQFHDSEIFSLTTKIMNTCKITLGQLCTVSGGVSTSADKVTNGNIRHCSESEIVNNSIQLGNGILLLTPEELKALDLDENELAFIKPLFKSSEIAKYVTNIEPNNFLIYADHNNAKEIMRCNKLFAHLERYKSILENRSQDIELENAMAKGYWFVLTNGRSKIDFSHQKIVCPYRTKDNVFGFNNTEWFGGRDIYFLVDFTEDINFILGILNSNLMKFWLKYKGKRKGDILEIYPEPLKNIPINNNNILKHKISEEVSKLLTIIDNDFKYMTNFSTLKSVNPIQESINQFVYELYEMDRNEIEAIERLII